MTFKDLLDASEKVETRVNAYWTYWSVVVIAVAGWLVSGNPIEPDQRRAICGALAAFFAANLCVLLPATRLAAGLRDELRIELDSAGVRSQQLRDCLSAATSRTRVQLTVSLHLVVDLALLTVVLR